MYDTLGYSSSCFFIQIIEPPSTTHNWSEWWKLMLKWLVMDYNYVNITVHTLEVVQERKNGGAKAIRK